MFGKITVTCKCVWITKLFRAGIFFIVYLFTIIHVKIGNDYKSIFRILLGPFAAFCSCYFKKFSNYSQLYHNFQLCSYHLLFARDCSNFILNIFKDLIVFSVGNSWAFITDIQSYQIWIIHYVVSLQREFKNIKHLVCVKSIQYQHCYSILV